MRLKIVAGNVIVLLVVGLGSYFYLKGELEGSYGGMFQQDVTTDAEMFARSWRLSSLEFVDQVSEQAETRQVRGAMRGSSENTRRRAAHDRANSIAAWFQDPARGRVGRPDIVALIDETGRVLARDQDPNRMSGTSLMSEIPTLRTVLEGRALHDGWFRDSENKLYQIAMAPIRNDEGGVLGALLVGYDISNGVAERESEGLGREVAFLREGQVYSSSLEQTQVSALQGGIGANGSLFEVQLGGDSYMGVAAALPATPSQDAGYVVLGNRSEVFAPISALNVLLILMGLGILLVGIYGFLIGTSLLRPIEEMEEGILNIINGKTDTRIDIEGGELGGLAYRVNQLINMLMGVEETDADGHSTTSGDWQGAAGMGAAAPAYEPALYGQPRKWRDQYASIVNLRTA